MALTLPRFTHEFSPTTNPFDPSPVFVDVSKKVRSWDCTRGRNHERNPIAPGSANFLLNDRGAAGREFDPLNTSGPYFGNLKPMRRWRTRGQWNLLTADQASAETSTTGLANLGNCTVGRSNTVAVDGTWSVTMTTIAGGSDTAMTTARGTSGITVSGGDIVSAVWSARTSLGVFRSFFIVISWFNSAGTHLSDSTGTTAIAQQSVWTQATITAFAPATAAFMSAALFIQGAGSSEVNYADAGGLFPVGGITVWSRGGPYPVFAGFIEAYPQQWSSPMDVDVPLRVYDYIPVLSRAPLITNTYAVEHAGDRIATALGLYPYPVGDLNLDVGVNNMAAASGVTGGSLLSYLQLVERSEGYPAVLFINAAGQITFYDALHASTVGGTFGDNTGEMPYQLDGTTVGGDDDSDIWNDWSMQRVGGTVQTAGDSTSQTAYGIRNPGPITGLLNLTDAAVLANVTNAKDRYKDTKRRYSSVHIHPIADPGRMFPQALGRDIHDQVTINRKAFMGGSATSIPSLIENVRHQVTEDGDMHTYWVTSPV